MLGRSPGSTWLASGCVKAMSQAHNPGLPRAWPEYNSLSYSYCLPGSASSGSRSQSRSQSGVWKPGTLWDTGVLIPSSTPSGVLQPSSHEFLEPPVNEITYLPFRCSLCFPFSKPRPLQVPWCFCFCGGMLRSLSIFNQIIISTDMSKSFNSQTEGPQLVMRNTSK